MPYEISIPREIIANHIVPHIDDPAVLYAIQQCLPSNSFSQSLKSKFAQPIVKRLHTKTIRYTDGVRISTNTYVHVYYALPNGYKHGDYYIYNNKGNLRKHDHFKDNLIDGKLLVYYSSGELKYKRHYVNGQLNGKFVKYRKDGSIDVLTYYKNDMLHVPWYSLYANGDKDVYCHYMYDKLHGVYTEYSNGIVIEITHYHDNLVHGLSACYHNKRNLKMEEEYMDGILVRSQIFRL